MFEIPYERDLPVPADAAFEWLTDYDDADGERAGAIVEARRTIASTDEHVVLEVRRVTFGLRETNTCTVTRDAHTRTWRATFEGGTAEGQVNDYRVDPVDGTSSRLVVSYRFPGNALRRAMLRLIEPFVRRSIDKMWDGFVESMVEEIGGPVTPASGT